MGDQLAALLARLAALEEEYARKLKEAEEHAADLVAQIATLQADLEQRDATARELRDQLAKSAARISDLEGSLAEKESASVEVFAEMEQAKQGYESQIAELEAKGKKDLADAQELWNAAKATLEGRLTESEAKAK